MHPHAVHSMLHPIYHRPTLLVVTMAPKRGSANPSAPRKYVKATPRGTQSQPVVIEDSQQSQRLSPR
jgi:hypothetical protein